MALTKKQHAEKYRKSPGGKKARKRHAKRYWKTKEGRASHARAMVRYRAKGHWKLLQWRADIKREFGLTEAEYLLLLEVQGGMCALCRKAGQTRAGGARLSVDHDHNTNRIRGLLCGRCNMALGLFNDDLETLKRAVEYLCRS